MLLDGAPPMSHPLSYSNNRGRASPKLKDATIEATLYPSLYAELVLKIRRMYHECKLVHADLSEYNIIYHETHLYIIDVSQSVEHDHPHAFDFLRNDIRNIEDYFGRYGVKCLGIRRCFEFVTKERVSEDGSKDEDALNKWLEEAGESSQADDEDEAGPEHEDSIFMQSYIPRTLNEVYDPERDVEAAQKGKSLIYAETIGIVDSKRKDGKVHFAKVDEDESDAESEDEEADVDGEEDADSSDEEGVESREDKQPRGHRHEDKDSKKVCGFFFYLCFSLV